MAMDWTTGLMQYNSQPDVEEDEEDFYNVNGDNGYAVAGAPDLEQVCI
jgi:hypothetical protein